jgi:hypothetical protein
LLFDKKFGPENLRDSIIEAIYSDSVELWVLTFCFVEIKVIVPALRVILPPVWLFMSMWMANAASRCQ